MTPPPTSPDLRAAVRFQHLFFLALGAALGGFLFGYDTAVINGGVNAIQREFGISDTAIGLEVGIALLGCAVGAWIAGALADRIGRLWTMRIAAVLFVLSALGSGLATDAWFFAVWRVVGGVAVGFASVISPAYIAEISPAAHRGRLGSMHQFAIVVGIFLSQLANFGIADLATANAVGGETGAEAALWGLDSAWRWMLLAAAVPAALYLLAAFRLPESPRFLVARDEVARARDLLGRLEGGDAAVISRRIDEIRASLGEERQAARVRDLFRSSTVRGLVVVAMLLAAFQQFVGINVIFYYSATLWQAVGFGEGNSLLISILSAVVNIVGTIIAIAVIDKVGRKPLLLVGSAGMALALGVTAWCFSHAVLVDDQASLGAPYGTIALIAANTFVFFFAFSWGPVVWVMISEIFPNRVRGAAVGLATATNWIANFLITVSFKEMAATSLTGTYAFYAIAATASGLFVWFFVAETKGQTLEEAGSRTIRDRVPRTVVD